MLLLLRRLFIAWLPLYFPPIPTDIIFSRQGFYDQRFLPETTAQKETKERATEKY
jgi:hypothetical protein